MQECDGERKVYCRNEARAVCTHCGLMLCLEHCGGAGSDCPDCNHEMEAIPE